MVWISRMLPKSPPDLKKLQICGSQTFSVIFRPPKSNCLFKPLSHMSRLLKKKAIPMIWFESQECYPKAHLTSKSFRFAVFRPLSVSFRPPDCPKRKPFQWYVLNLKNATQKPTWPQKASGLWFFDLFRSFSDHLKATACLNLCLTCLDCSKRKPFQQYVLNLKNATRKPTWPQKAPDLWFSDIFRSFSDHLKATAYLNLCLTCPNCSKKKAIPMICFESQECYPKAHLTSKSFRFVVFRPFSVFFRPPKSNYLFKPLPHMSKLLKKKAVPMIWFESQECYPKAHLTSKSFRFVVFRPFSVIFRPPKSNCLFKPLPHMSKLLKKKAIPMIWFESQECYPKAHLTSKSFRFVVFRPFSVFFRPPKSNYLFKPLPHMSRLLKEKAIPMICFESSECYPKAHLTSKSFRFVVFRPFSVIFRPPKSNCLFKPLPHMSKLLKKKAIPMICFESQECYPKAHLTSKSCRFVVFRHFSVFFRPPKSNCLFKPLPHMSKLLKKKAIPMIWFESQECYPKAHLTSKSFRFVVFRPFSVLFRPPKSNCLFKPLTF